MRGSIYSPTVEVGWSTAFSLSSALFFFVRSFFSMDFNTAYWTGKAYERVASLEVSLSCIHTACTGTATDLSLFAPGDRPLRRRGVDGASVAAAATAGVALPTC